MTQEKLKTYLDPALARLERVYSDILATQGFTQDTEKLLILIELLKEQRPHENSSHTTSETR